VRWQSEAATPLSHAVAARYSLKVFEVKSGVALRFPPHSKN
jgi:hypothetical protein